MAIKMAVITWVIMMCLAASSMSHPSPLDPSPSHPHHMTPAPSYPDPPAPAPSYPDPPAPALSYPDPPAPSPFQSEYPSHSGAPSPSLIPSGPRARLPPSRPLSSHSQSSATPTSASHPAAPHLASASYGLPPSYFSFASYNQPHFAAVPPKYSYKYGVADDYSGANYGHSESRDGYKTEGSYTVDLPDGRKQTVTYVDNGDGYEANVIYEGEVLQSPPSNKPAPPPPAPPSRPYAQDILS